MPPNPNGSAPCRLVVVHPSATIRAALRSMIEADGRFEVVADAPVLAGLTRAAAQTGATLVLVDGSLADDDAVTALCAPAGGGPKLHVAVACARDAGASALKWFRAGASAVLAWDDEPEVLFSHLALVADGDTVLSRSVAPDLQSLLPVIPGGDDERLGRAGELSARELEILRYVAGGSTNPEISERLHITEHTVKAHVSSILEKLDVRNRQQATGYALQQGLVSGVEFVDRDVDAREDATAEPGNQR